MKNYTVITSTGSFHLLTILVELMLVCSFMACRPSDKSSDLLAENISDYLCQDKCDRAYFKPFSGKSVHVEVEPTGELAQVFYNVDPETIAKNPLVLNETVQITGKIVGDEKIIGLENNKRDKSANFTDIIALPVVNSLQFLSPRIPTIKTAINQDAHFDMTVLSGLSYSFILNPNGSKDRAPFYINPGVIDGPKKLDFNINTQQLRLSGRVIAKDRLLSVSKDKQMVAKIMQGNRLASSVGLIGRDGRFSLELSNPLIFEEQLPIDLILEPLNEAYLPMVKVKLMPEELKVSLNIKDIDLGSLMDPISTKIEVHGSDGSLIDKAYLFLRAQIAAGETTLKLPIDPSGVTKLERLYEGVYDVAVVPPSNSPFAMKLIKAVKFDKNMEDIFIVLPKKQALNAEIFAPTGIPVNGAQIEFSRIGEVGNFATEDIYDDMLFKLVANTDSQGKMCHRRFGYNNQNSNQCLNLLLDSGRYLAHIIPPAGSQLAHKWVTLDFPKQNDLIINLDQPQVLVGQVISFSQQEPIKHAFVTIYLADNNLHNQSTVIGNAITDEQGFFKAFVSMP